MQDINLTTLAREVAADSGLHDPREIAEKMLASSVFVNGEWKSFGDCTRSDVGWLAEQRRAEAARNLAQAAVYDEVDALMAEHGVETLAGLPRDVVPAALEVAA